MSAPHQSNWDVLLLNDHITVRFDEVCLAKLSSPRFLFVGGKTSFQLLGLFHDWLACTPLYHLLAISAFSNLVDCFSLSDELFTAYSWVSSLLVLQTCR